MVLGFYIFNLTRMNAYNSVSFNSCQTGTLIILPDIIQRNITKPSRIAAHRKNLSMKLIITKRNLCFVNKDVGRQE